MFTCKKCGAKAHSKCPNDRTVFLEDQWAALLSHIVKFPETSESDGWWTINLSVRLKIPEIENEEQAELEALTMIQSTKLETLKTLVCEHHWTLPKGEKCDFGHAHR